jgi:hypothetical protein
MRLLPLGLLAAALAASAACATPAVERKATLARADEATMQALRAGLARALGRGEAVLGPGDLTQRSEVSVLPPPLGPNETRSLAAPTLFTLVLRGGRCMALRSDTGAAYPLPGVGCKPAP